MGELLQKQVDKLEGRVGKLEVLEAGGGGPPTGAAGGDLTGTYPNPTLAAVVAGATVTNPSSLTFNSKGQITAGTTGTAPVTSVSGTSPIASSGGTTPAISIAITPANPGGAVALQAGTPGTQQTGNENISGKLITGGDIASSGDVSGVNVTGSGTVQGANVVATTAFKGVSSGFPTIGTTTLAEKMGNIYLANGNDIFPDNDQYGLWDRMINWGITPDEHWGQGADELTWTGYAAYTGFVTPAIITTANSNYIISHNAAAKSFRYRAAATGAHIYLRSRLAITYIVSAGLMIDDGVNNADGNGANNFYRVYLTQSALAGTMTAVEQYRTGGGAVTTNVGPTMPYGQYAGLRLHTVGTRWTSWTATPATFGEIGLAQAVQFTTGSAAFSWTPARVGLYGVFTAVDGSRKAIFDWYDEATS